MWFVDLMLVLPSFLIIAILSPTFRGTDVAGLRRAARRVPLDDHGPGGARHDDLAARARVRLGRAVHGRPAHRIILRHILPNIASFLIVDATINVGAAVITEIGAVLLRLRRPAAGRLARHPDRRRHRVGDDLSVAVLLRRRAAGRVRPGGQPGRRRAARRPRPDLGGPVNGEPPPDLRPTAEDLAVTFPGRPAPCAPCAGSTTAAARRGARHRRRVGLGQVRHRARRPRAAAAHRHRPGLDAARRRGTGRPRRQARSRVRGNRIAMVFQDPLSPSPPSTRSASRSPRPCASTSDVTGQRRPRAAVELLDSSASRTPPSAPTLPARVLGRHAAARDDRHGDRQRPRRHPRRRADHRAGRDDRYLG